MTHPRGLLLDVLNTDDLVALNKVDLGHGAQLLDRVWGEVARIAVDVGVDVFDAKDAVDEGLLLVCGGEEVEVVLHGIGGCVLLQDDDVRVVDMAVLLVLGEGGGGEGVALSGGVEGAGGERCTRDRAS
jgi:hypothetical protein